MPDSQISMAEFTEHISAYEAVRSVYDVFARILRQALSDAVNDLGIDAIVQARAKTIPSFAEKMIRKREKYPLPVLQFTDLCAARVIVPCKDDLEAVCEFIRRHFEIEEDQDVV